MRKIIYIIIFCFLYTFLSVKSQDADFNSKIEVLENKIKEQQHNFDRIEKQIDDLLWFQRLGDIAYVDKVFITGPPPSNVKNPDAVGANNPVRFWNYVFIPRNIDRTKVILY